MPITKEDVQHMAKLARLHVDDATQELFTRQFADILTYMDALGQVDTSAVEPLYSPSLHISPVRADAAHSHCERAEVLANAPQQDGQYFVVPRIV